MCPKRMANLSDSVMVAKARLHPLLGRLEAEPQ